MEQKKRKKKRILVTSMKYKPKNSFCFGSFDIFHEIYVFIINIDINYAIFVMLARSAIFSPNLIAPLISQKQKAQEA